MTQDSPLFCDLVRGEREAYLIAQVSHGEPDPFAGAESPATLAREALDAMIPEGLQRGHDLYRSATCERETDRFFHRCLLAPLNALACSTTGAPLDPKRIASDIRLVSVAAENIEQQLRKELGAWSAAFGIPKPVEPDWREASTRVSELFSLSGELPPQVRDGAGSITSFSRHCLRCATALGYPGRDAAPSLPQVIVAGAYSEIVENGRHYPVSPEEARAATWLSQYPGQYVSAAEILPHCGLAPEQLALYTQARREAQFRRDASDNFKMFVETKQGRGGGWRLKSVESTDPPQRSKGAASTA